MTIVAPPQRVLFFRTYGEALQNWQEAKRGQPKPFDVSQPPTREDFVAHGNFHRGELTFEDVEGGRWGGSFGQRSAVHLRWGTDRCTHNHPRVKTPLGGFPSRIDIRILGRRGLTVIITSPFGIFRTRRNTELSNAFQPCMPEVLESDVTMRLPSGKLTPAFVRLTPEHTDRVNHLLANLGGTVGQMDSDLATGASFMSGSFPIGYSKWGAVEFGEVSFVSWRHFGELMEAFHNDPHELIAPHRSWGLIF